jgi:HEAT repeat protein
MSARRAHEAFSDPQRAGALHTIALKMLADLTNSSDPQTRANAIEAFQRVPDQLEYYARRGLKDENVGVRAVSAMVVGRQKMVRLVEDVRPLLDDESPYVWTAAAYALKACGKPDERALNRMVALLLSSPSTRVRSHIAVMLGDLGERSALGPLTDAIINEPIRADPRQLRLMELQIAEAMYKLGDDDQIGVIRAALYPSQIYELEAMALAAQILGEVRDVRSAGALVGLAKGTREEVLPAEVRLAAAGSLAQLGHPQGAYIAEEYKSNDNPALRAQSAYVYGRTGQVQNLARLEASLWDPSTLVRAAAADGILRILERSNTQVNRGP